MIRGSCLSAVAAALYWASPQPALAQEFDYTASQQLFGEPVTNSVTGAPMRISDSPLQITVLTGDDIEASPSPDIAGLLRNEGDVSFKERAIGQDDIGIRGFNQPSPRGTLVLVDGRQVYLDHYGSTDWEAIPIQKEDIQQIETIKGPNGALYGFNATSGVINIITKDPLFDRHSFAVVEGGTQDDWRLAAGITIPISDIGGLRISGGREQSSEFSDGLPANTPSALTDRERNTVNSDLSLRLTDDTTARLEISHSDVKHSAVGPFYTLSDVSLLTNAYQGSITRALAAGSISGTLYVNSLTQGALSNEVWVGRLTYLRKLDPRNTVRISTEYRDNTTRQTAPGFDFGITYRVISESLMWDWAAADSLSIVNAVRLDHLDLGADQAPPPGTPYTRNDYSRAFSKVSFNSAALYKVTDLDQVRLSLAKGTQIPSLVDFGLAAGVPTSSGSGTAFFLGGDPANRVTTVWNYEAGWRHLFASARSSVGIVLFHTVRSDVISAPGFAPDAFGPGPIYLFTNRGSSKINGVELDAQGDVGRHWHWLANYLNSDVNDDFDFPFGAYPFDFQDVQPRHVANAVVRFDKGRVEATLASHYESRSRELGIGTTSFVPVTIKAYFDVDARLAYRLSDHVTIALSGTQLLYDAQRQSSVGKVERRVLVSLNAHL